MSTAVQRGTWGRRVINLCTSCNTALVKGMFFRSSYVAHVPTLMVLPISSCTFSGRSKESSKKKFRTKKRCVPARQPTPGFSFGKNILFQVWRERILKTPSQLSPALSLVRHVHGPFSQHHALVSTLSLSQQGTGTLLL